MAPAEACTAIPLCTVGMEAFAASVVALGRVVTDAGAKAPPLALIKA
jgi:hypothetical protein